ncbi:RAC-beta serine/threonine-protein kinase A-like [Montipora capricornis]|uniref:RAC-beta serine/threonine-protein kinase A-like n=1 Tax=Montipora capricornis TaxID=246305 RepID=UPI0035F1C54D
MGEVCYNQIESCSYPPEMVETKIEENQENGDGGEKSLLEIIGESPSCTVEFYLLPCRHLLFQNAANIIQNAWRQYKLKKIAKIAMESAAVVIQNAWRQYKLQKLAKIAMENAAIIIQNAWWQYKLQKVAKIAMESAAVVIQNAWRQYKLQKIAKIASENAAIIIQNAWRQYKLQKLAKIAMENAAIIIQNAWRQYKLQKIAKIAIEKAARCIQNAWKLFKLQKQRRVEMSKIELKRKADVSPQELGHPPAKLQRLENITWVSSMNNFQYIRHLGTGGFANVLLFHNQNTTQEFAFKVQDRTNRTIFLNEVKALSAAQASNFVTKLCGSFSIRNLLFLVFQFLPGGDLENHILRYGRLAINAARFYACEIICAVQYLHHRGIIHRDLKLDNVLIDHDGHIRVGDFGLSTFMESEESRNACCGTIYYLAPEMLLRNFYDTSVDWWAIGVIIYRLLTAEFPFFSEDEDEVAVTKAILYSPLYIPDFISSEAEDCLTQFLERTPQLRLGYEKGNFPSLKYHPFFYAIAWEDVANGELEPPFVPCQSEAWNTSCNSSSSLSEHSPSISRRRRTSYFPSID